MFQDPVLAGGLARVLAGNTNITCKARLIGWIAGERVVGPRSGIFFQDHRDLCSLCDEIATQFIQQGGVIPCSLEQLRRLSSVQDVSSQHIHGMLAELSDDHAQMIHDCEFVLTLQGDQLDSTVEDLLSRCIAVHKSCADRLTRLKSTVQSQLQ
ncbi:MAG: hypothetical protein AAF220_01430 [Pseudomonadota bacterium]